MDSKNPRINGCCARALQEVIMVLNEEGIDTELINIGTSDIRGCIACSSCKKNGKCVFNDIVNDVADKFKDADGLIVASPVYYSGPNGSLISLLDRLFYSTPFSKHMKVGASIVSARRAGNSSTFDVLNKYFTISGMVIPGSTYWNNVHGFTKEDVEKDLEGLQTMRNLARNISFLVKAIHNEKEKNGLPLVERNNFTSFPDGK